MKGMTVAKNISYLDLLEKIHDLTKIDRRTHSIQMKVLYHVHEPLPSEIEGDYDLEYFLSCNIDKSIVGTNLCISTSPRENISNEGFNSDNHMGDRNDLGDFAYDLRNDGCDIGSDGYDSSSTTKEDNNNSKFPEFPCNMDVEEKLVVVQPQSCQGPSVVGSNSLVGNSQSSESEVASVVLKVGELFREKKSMYRTLCMYAMKKHFQFRVVKSTKSLFVARCTKSHCKWWLRATLVKDTHFFMIKKFVDVHVSSACLEFLNHHQATAMIIGEDIKSKYEGVSVIYRPNDIRRDFKMQHGVTINYGKAWRARESALCSLHGSPEDSFTQLPHFFAQLEMKNPGSITHIEVDDENHFQHCFMAIGACLRGFHSCIRPVICINGTHLKGKAWRARESALCSLHGSPEDSFTQLPHFFAQLEMKNPGSITHIEVDDENHFQHCFMAIGACLRGFHSCIRPVICINGTHLKGKYMGTLFIATSLDGNNQVFPLAFGVGPSETYASWQWFLTKLRAALGDVESLVIVSDRHKAIAKAVEEVYPDALHALCVYHLSQNLLSKKFPRSVVSFFYCAEKCYRIVDFNHMMDEIKFFDLGKVYDYLMEVGFEKWSHAHFPGDRYDLMTTNIAECLNAVLKDARMLPITKLMDHIRGKLQTWFYDRRIEAAAMPNVLTKHWDDIVSLRREKAGSMSVEPISFYELYVRGGDLPGHVDLSTKTCSCRAFDTDKLPCVHACAACAKRELPIHSVSSHYYTTEMLILAWSEAIVPVMGPETWPTLEGSTTLLPLIAGKRAASRPRKRRIPSQGETVNKRICSRCKQQCHNRQTCDEPVALHPPALIAPPGEDDS